MKLTGNIGRRRKWKKSMTKRKLIDTDALLSGLYDENPKDVALYIANFPEAQPEIIKCKDCEHHGKEICYMLMLSCYYGAINTPDEGYCHRAERKTDE